MRARLESKGLSKHLKRRYPAGRVAAHGGRSWRVADGQVLDLQRPDTAAAKLWPRSAPAGLPRLAGLRNEATFPTFPHETPNNAF